MLFDPVESFEDSPIEFSVKAVLEDTEFNNSLNQLENRIDSSDSLQDKRIIVSGYVNLDDTLARQKINLLKTELEATINLAVNSKINIESTQLNNTLAYQNGIFSKNLERILKDANKESFLGKIGNIITAPVRALGASLTQVVKGSLFSVGEAAVRPVQARVADKLAPVVSFVADRSANVIDNTSKFVQQRSGLDTHQVEGAFNYLGNKIDNIFDARNIYQNIKSGIGYAGKLEYESKDSSNIFEKSNKIFQTIKTDISNQLSNIFDNVLTDDFNKINTFVDKLDGNLINLSKSIVTLLGTTADLTREFKFYGAIQDTIKTKNKINYQLDPNKPTTIFVGGSGDKGKHTDYHASTFAAAYKGNTVSVRNTESDNKADSGIIFNLLRNTLDKLNIPRENQGLIGLISTLEHYAKNAFNITKDEVNIAANALYAKDITTNTQIVAYCSGNLVAKGAAEILERGFCSNIQAKGFALSPFDVARQPTNNYQTIISSGDPGILANKFTAGKAKVFDQGKNIDRNLHGAINYYTSKESSKFLGVQSQLSPIELLKNTFNKGDNSSAQKLARYQRSLEDNKDNLLQNTENILNDLDSRVKKIRDSFNKSLEINSFEASLLSIHDNIKITFNALNHNLISTEDALKVLKSNSLAIHYDLGSTKQNFGDEYKTNKSSYNVITPKFDTGTEYKPNNYQIVKPKYQEPNYQLPLPQPVNLQPRVNVKELADDIWSGVEKGATGIKNTLQAIEPVADLATGALNRVVGVLGEIAGERLEARVEQLRGVSEQPILKGSGDTVTSSAITPREIGQIAATDIARTGAFINNATENIIKFADGTIKAGKNAKEFILGLKSQGKTIKDLGNAVIEVSAELVTEFDQLDGVELKQLSAQVLRLKESISTVEGNKLLPSSEINEEKDNVSKLVKVVYDLSNAFDEAKQSSLDISSTQTGLFDINKLQNSLLIIEKLEKALKDARKVEKLSFAEGHKELIPQVRDIQNPIGRLKSNAYKGILAQLPQIKEAAEAGDNTAQGFIQGLKSKIPLIEESANDAGNKFILQIKQVLGIASPAKRLIEIGNQTIQGFIVGSKNKLTDIKNLANSLKNEFLDNFKIDNKDLNNKINLNKLVITNRSKFVDNKGIEDPLTKSNYIKNKLRQESGFNTVDKSGNVLGYKKNNKGIEDPLTKSNYIKNKLKEQSGFNTVDKSGNVLGYKKSNKVETKSYFDLGKSQGTKSIDFIGNSYNYVITKIKESSEATRRFILGNKEIQNSANYVKGFASNWSTAKDKLGGYLSQFQVFGIQGSTFAKLGLGAVGIFAFAKGVEFLTSKLSDLIEVSRQTSKVNQFFQDATSKPEQEIKRITDFANKAGIEKLPLLQSSAEQLVGLKTLGYDEKKSSDLLNNLTKVSLGRRFTPSESKQFFKPILQIGSKGKFSQEEVQQQLADIGIYGAGKIAAKATGYGNDTPAFLKATSQGDVSANIVGKDGLTNLERFVKLLEKTYGSDKELDPLVAVTARLNNNIVDLQSNSAKVIEPFVQLSDPIINSGVSLLSNNVGFVVGGLKTLAVVSTALVIPSLISMAAKSTLLSGAFAAINAQGVIGATTTAIGASKWAIWGLAATAAVTTVTAGYKAYIDNASEATKALQKLIDKENERKNGGKKELPNKGLDNRLNALGTYGSSISSSIGSIITGNFVEGANQFNKASRASIDIFTGQDTATNVFGTSKGIITGKTRDDRNATNEQLKNRKERDTALQVIKNNKSVIDEANILKNNLAKGIQVDPDRLSNSQNKVNELNKAFKLISPSVLEGDISIKSFANTLTQLDEGLYDTSIKSRNLTLEMNQLKSQLEENKTVSLNIDLETEQKKAFLPFNDTKVTSKFDFTSEQGKLEKQIELQSKLAELANEKYTSSDYQNLINSEKPEQQEKALQIKSEALQQKQSLIELQVQKQKSINNRRKELLSQEKEELLFITSSRKIKSDISGNQLKNETKVNVYSKFGNLDSIESKMVLAKSNLDSISNQLEQSALDISDNQNLYKKGLIFTQEYQINLLNLRKEQISLEGQFNDSLIELDQIEKEKINNFQELILKQKEYENKIKDNSFSISQTIIEKYGAIKKEIRSLNDQINSLTFESLNNLGDVISSKIDQIKNIFKTDKDLEGNNYVLNSYLRTLEKISGIRINRDDLSKNGKDGEEAKAKLIYNIELAKVNIQIQGVKLKKDSLIEELVIQRQLLTLEQQKAKFNADQDVEKARINLDKANLKGDNQGIRIAEIDLTGAERNREFLLQNQQLQRTASDRIDNLKIKSLDVEGAKLSLDLKKGLLDNQTLKPFGDTDPYKNLTNIISRQLTPFENSTQYQRRDFSNDISKSSPLPALNIINNFGESRQDNLDYGTIGRQIGTEALKALQQYKASIVGSI